MTDLPSRLQAAAEGSAELDRDVLLACGWQFRLVDEMLVTEYRWFDAAGREHVGPMSRPTRSLDDITRMIEGAGMRWHRMESGGFIVSADDFGSICSLMMTGPLSLTHGMISVLNFRAWRARATP